MNDSVNSLYEHLKNRLAIGYGYGDDEQTIIDKVPDHRVSSMSLREDHPGDVGIFEYLTNKEKQYDNIDSHTLWSSRIQISAVVKEGNIEICKRYLKESFDNIISDKESDYIYISGGDLLNITPSGKNKDGFQVVIINIMLYYYINYDKKLV